MTQRVCVIGGATWDVFFTTTQADLIKDGRRDAKPVLAFPYGGKVDAADIMYGFGGGAANVAIGLANLGVRADIVTRIGQDWRGAEIIKNLHRSGVGTKQVQKDRQEKTALAFIVTAGQGRDHVAFVARGASANLNTPSKLSNRYQWCYFTAMTAKNWYVRLEKLFRSFSRQGGKIFWNPGAAQLSQPHKLVSLLPYVTVLDVNKDEATLLLDKLRRKHTQSVSSLIMSLRALGPKLVLITCGNKGAYLADSKQIRYQPVYNVKPINTTGAGDAFGSGFLAGYITSGSNLKVAMQWGMLNSNAVIMQVGAQKGLLNLRTVSNFQSTYDRT